MALREPERFSGYLVLNMTHPWLTPRLAALNAPRSFAYMPLVAGPGVPIQRRTRFVEYLIRGRYLEPEVGQPGRRSEATPIASGSPSAPKRAATPIAPS